MAKHERPFWGHAEPGLLIFTQWPCGDLQLVRYRSRQFAGDRVGPSYTPRGAKHRDDAKGINLVLLTYEVHPFSGYWYFSSRLGRNVLKSPWGPYVLSSNGSQR